MSDKIEAEDRIASAFFVLKCIWHNNTQLHDVARAIERYVSGDFESAAALAHFIARAPTKPRSQQSLRPPKSLGELELMFQAARRNGR